MPRNKKSSIKEYLIEFAIVISGITIAFWLSNLGEVKKENRLEDSYLEQLRDDFITDIKVFDRGLTASEKNVDFLQKGLEYIHRTQRDRLSADSVSKVALTLGDFSFFFKPTNDTYLTLQQSGDLKIIKSMELKKKIVNLYKNYELIRLEQVNFIEALDDNFFPNMYDSYDLLNEKVVDPAFFHSILCINFIGFTAQETQTLNNLFRSSRKLALETIDFIENMMGSSNLTQNEAN